MSSRQRDKYRKFDSGHQKRQKKQNLEKNLKKQRGALDKFVFSSDTLERVAEEQNEIECYEEELILEGDTEQPCCSKEFVTQNSIEIVEKSSDLTIINNEKIMNEIKEAEINFSDPDQWPSVLNP
ncbi:unnamed protein product [Macrosiphum euphorbiae]|uniref:Uncharacterized protein n=1 Tax=Macrosiphum euphorbiae TaxID=13131 RepID=A0AAV0XB62_9HEMI|nr:unnamed protein product [Macrosiphum euphorbiae]